MVKCDKCSYSAPRKATVLSHQRSVHSDVRPWACTFPGCNYKAKRKYRLVEHNFTHTTELKARKLHACTHENCQFRATTLYTLRKHIIAKHTPGRTRDLQCPLCSSKFYRKSHLVGHVSRHTKEKRFKCDFCEFTGFNREAVNLHAKAVHKKLKDLQCAFPGCNFRTAQSGHLKVHRQQHDPDPAVQRPFPCHFPNCDYRASTSVILRSHTRARHDKSRSKTFICPMCSKSYFTKYEMTVHVKLVHARENKYNCDHCVNSLRIA